MTSYWCLTSTNEVPLQLPLIVSAAQASWSNLFFLVKRWGFPTIRHNELRDLTAHLLTQVCHGVKTEPDLQPLTGETLSRTSANSSDGVRREWLFGGRFEQMYLDVRVFNPLAVSNSNMDISKCIKWKVEGIRTKIRETKHSSFTPLVFSATPTDISQQHLHTTVAGLLPLF